MNLHVPPKSACTRPRSVEDIVDDFFDRKDKWHNLKRQDSRLAQFMKLVRREQRRRRWLGFIYPNPKRSNQTNTGWFTDLDFPNMEPSWTVPSGLKKAVTVGLVATTLAVGAKVAFAETVDKAMADFVVFVSEMIQSDASVERESQIEENKRCAVRQQVLDADGNSVGLVPLTKGDCSTANYRYVYSPVSEDVASSLADALETLEGQSRIGPRTILGVLDVPAAGKRVLETITQNRQLSGSPPLLSAIEAVDGRPYAMGFSEKIASIWSAAVYSARHLRSNKEREAFMATGMACLRGVSGSNFGYPISGGLCITAMFGNTKPENLQPGQYCLWAAAMGFPIAIAREGSNIDGYRKMGKTLQKTKKRAGDCLNRLDIPQSNKTAQMSYVDQYQLPKALLERPVSAYSAGFGYTLSDELRLTNLSPSDKPVHLGFSIPKQKVVYEKATKYLEGVNQHLSNGICFGKPGCTEPDLAMVVAEIHNNRLIAKLAISNRYGLLRGPIAKDSNGSFYAQPSIISHGSIGKLAPILTIAGAGKQTLCNKAFGNIQNQDGSMGYESCKIPASQVPTKISVARSDNLPFIKEMISYSDELRQVLTAVPIQWDRSLSPAKLAVETVLGYGATAPILTEMQLLAAISNGRDGRPAMSGPVELLSSTKIGPDINLANAGIDADAVKLTANWLEGPLSFKNGTLTSFANVLKSRGCEPLIGKSGSAETSQSKSGVSLKGALLTFKCGDREFVAGLTLGAPNGADDVLGSVKTSHLAPLLGIAVGSL